MKTLATACLLGMPCLPAAAEQSSLAWGYNTYGSPGLIDMPTAVVRPDAELAFSVSHFRNQTRTAATFQLLPRLSTTFRYSILDDLPGELYDRSFSLHYQLLDEGRWRPAVGIGLRDLIGTAVYGGEYIVASKTLTERLRGTVGLGWGRLAGVGGFSNPLGLFGRRWDTRPKPDVGVGGTFDTGSWFRGDAAFFGGLEWQATDQLRFVVEYSSDAYLREEGTAFKRRSPVNFGLSWQATPATSLAVNYLYGSEVGLQLTHWLNPRQPPAGSGFDPAPPPVMRRDAAALADSSDLRAALAAEGILLSGQRIDGPRAHVEIENRRYSQPVQALGRAARILTRTMPPEVDLFEVTLSDRGLPVSTTTLRRYDIERLEFAVDGAAELLETTRIDDPSDLPPDDPARYPAFQARLLPYVAASYFDPGDPIRMDGGLSLWAAMEPARGLLLSGTLRHKLVGNIGDMTSDWPSVLPHVRSDGALYHEAGGTAIANLYGAYYFRTGESLYGRVTMGLLEPMFAGVSTELLWMPDASRFALGVEINRVRQRDYAQDFGLLDYSVTTGHVSGYYDIGHGFQAQVDVGRYLAGDRGMTLSINREFENGWKVGAFATRTNVSAEDFGEGSFDKGITVTIPIDWMSGKPSSDRFAATVRPLQRDGGARLDVPGRLYSRVRPLQEAEMIDSWGRFWR